MRFLALFFINIVVLAAGCMESQERGTTAQESTPTSTTLKASEPGVTIAITTPTTESESDMTVEPPTITVKLPANMSGCRGLENATLKDWCYYDVAGKDRNIEVCDSIADKNTVLKCKARLEENPDYCEQIDRLSEKDWCYWTMAFKWNKIRYCKVIFAQPIKDKCVHDFVTGKKPDPMECFSIINTVLRDDCIYFHIGEYERTGSGIKPNLCILINNQTLQLRCNQTFLKQP